MHPRMAERRARVLFDVVQRGDEKVAALLESMFEEARDLAKSQTTAPLASHIGRACLDAYASLLVTDPTSPEGVQCRHNIAEGMRDLSAEVSALLDTMERFDEARLEASVILDGSASPPNGGCAKHPMPDQDNGVPVPGP